MGSVHEEQYMARVCDMLFQVGDQHGCDVIGFLCVVLVRVWGGVYELSG